MMNMTNSTTKNSEMARCYVLVNASNGEAIGAYQSSISSRVALDMYLKSVFSKESVLTVDVFVYRLVMEDKHVHKNYSSNNHPHKISFTRDNHLKMLNTVMI